MIDARLERWLKASIALYFDQGKEAYTLFIEGQDIDLATQILWTELRINGPRYQTLVGGNYNVDLEINLACSAKMGTDLYAIEEMVGFFRNLAQGPILINKYKDTDPAEFIGCLNLRDNEPIDVVPWGQVSLPGPIRVTNTTIDAYYRLEI